MFYIKQVLIAFDQCLNALFGGWSDETLSAHAYRASNKGQKWAVVTRAILDVFLSPLSFNHCQKAYESEKERRQLPPEYRP